MLVFHPPAVEHVLTWRRLYSDGAFGQRELVHSSTFNSRAKERETSLGIGDASLKHLHEVGALRPVAFSRGAYWAGMQVPSEPVEQMVFSDEEPSDNWAEYEFELDGHAHVNALYSQWQHLAAIDAVEAGTFTVPLWVVAGQPDAGAKALEQLRGWAQGQDASWRALDAMWRPLMMTLVRLQNRYWPEITHRTTLLFDPNLGERVDPFTSERETFDAKSVFERDFCEDRDGLLAMYHDLVDRGLRRDPRDGLTLLRRARSRAFHIRWRGEPRRAQDHFDAADLIRRFLADIDGTQPGQAEAVPMDGRQDERAALYARGPAGGWTGEEVVHALQKADLYPHGVHVVHEGDSEQIVVEMLVGGLLGRDALAEVSFTDLGGAGNAGVVGDLVGSLDGYARRVVVILDDEAQARSHVEAAIASGGISAEDVLLFDSSLEEANASDEELVALAVEIAAAAGEELTIAAAELRAFHDERVRRAGERGTDVPGLASSLEQVVRRATSGRWHLRKRDLVEQLAILLVREVHETERDGRSRPLIDFVINRIVPPLNRPYPIGPS
jgi:hypothetical protein